MIAWRLRSTGREGGRLVQTFQALDAFGIDTTIASGFALPLDAERRIIRSVLRDRLNVLKADRERALAALDRAKAQVSPYIEIDRALLEEFGRVMRKNLTSGTPQFRKAYLQAIVSTIEVEDHLIRIKGHKDRLEPAIFAVLGNIAECSQMSPKWRAIQNKTANTYVIEITT